MSAPEQGRTILNHVVLLPVDNIFPNPAQPRLRFSEKSLGELAASIAQNGLLQPISVREVRPGQYQVIAGERRLRAFRKLGCTDIPAIIEEVDDLSSKALALIENLQRDDLNFFEQAAAIAGLLREHELTQSELSRRLGIAQSTLANKLRILRLCDEAKKRILEGSLSERHARALLALPNDSQILAAIEQIINRQLNVAQTEQLVAVLLEKDKPKPTRLFILKDVRIFINTINKAVEMMKQAGIPAKAERDESEEFISVTVRIPKKAATKQSTA